MPPTSRNGGGRMPPSAPGATVVPLSAVGALADMSMVEFCLGMALARRAPQSAGELAAEVSAWFDRPVRPRALNAPLDAMLGRGWVAPGAGTYTLSEAGLAALTPFTHALVRMLDGGRRLLDLAVFMSLIKDFERSGS
ncbi:hypothetical protein SAMN06295987_107124 [Novosphingobium mathurense]|uniref:Transcriptional regulator, PadR family n=2 Tax=Novosphingobium mathurense TaxID=428990 RepID=A0A1U6IJC6_9SPHN|nr:hypothetical protein SAMN06295987_107124 [Novosphingobium mathurense]